MGDQRRERLRPGWGYIHSDRWGTVEERDLWFTWWLVERSGEKDGVTEVAVWLGWHFPPYPDWFGAPGEDFQGHAANWGHFWSPHLCLREKEKMKFTDNRSLFEKCSHWLFIEGQTLKTFLMCNALLDKAPRPPLYSYAPSCRFLLHWQKQPFA